jgi:hypothetical protein
MTRSSNYATRFEASELPSCKEIARDDEQRDDAASAIGVGAGLSWYKVAG